MRLTGKSKRRFRIVLADDQQEVRGSVRRFIERDGQFDIVAEVENGSEAIRVVDAERPDALILDLAMPGVDGLEALAAIMQEAPDTRVVVLSSMVPFNGIKAQALSIGAVGAFDKYTSPKKVIRALVAALSDDPQPVTSA